MEKTVKEWLSELPEPYKARALANLCRPEANKRAAEMKRDSIAQALVVAFMWSVTPEGAEFWKAVYEYFMYGSPLPIIKRGGARPGAGPKRKPGGTVKQSKTFTLDPDVVAHKPTSALVNQLLRNEYGI